MIDRILKQTSLLSILLSAQIAIAFAEPLNGNITHVAPLAGGVTKDAASEKIDESEQALLSKYETVIILDQSTSMRGHDCSVPHSSNLIKKIVFASNVLLSSASAGMLSVPTGDSRWKLAVDETRRFLIDTAGIYPNGLKICTYGLIDHTYKNVRPDNFDQLFKNKSPFGGTYPAGALANVFKDYFKTRDQNKNEVKPLLVILISDCGFDYGRCNQTRFLQNIIAAATKKITSQNEITLYFVKTGLSPGANISAINTHFYLFSKKPKYNIVRYINFHDLRTYGLTKAIIYTLISQNNDPKQTLAPSGND